MEREMTLKESLLAFLINIVLFLAAAAICGTECY